MLPAAGATIFNTLCYVKPARSALCRNGFCSLEEGACALIHDRALVVPCAAFAASGRCVRPGCPLQHKVVPKLMPMCTFFFKVWCGLRKQSFAQTPAQMTCHVGTLLPSFSRRVKIYMYACCYTVHLQPIRSYRLFFADAGPLPEWTELPVCACAERCSPGSSVPQLSPRLLPGWGAVHHETLHAAHPHGTLHAAARL